MSTSISLYRLFLPSALAALLIGALPIAAQETTRELVVREATPKLIEALMDKADLNYTEIGNNKYRCTMAGLKVLVFIQKGDLQLFAAFSGGSVSQSTINEWNKKHRFSRAYLDDVDDPVLESDLGFSGGVTGDTLVEFFRTFRASVTTFKEHIQK